MPHQSPTPNSNNPSTEPSKRPAEARLSLNRLVFPQPARKELCQGTIVAIVFAALYLVPNLLEVCAASTHVPLVSCVVFGDIVGCAILFIIGLRVTAVGIYAFAMAVEALLLWPIGMSGAALVWMTGLLPAVVVAVFLFLRLALSSAGGIPNDQRK